MSIESEKVKNIIEAALFAADKPMSIDNILSLFDPIEQPDRSEIKDLLKTIQDEYQQRGIELKEISSGYRFQVRQQYSEWVSKLWEEKPPRYSRALLETLALIAYRQPITRAEIEDVRGVGVSTNIIKTLQERDWIKVVGHRDVPGRPALFATTKGFLDYFNLKSMDELPTLAEIKDLDKISEVLNAEGGSQQVASEAETEVDLDVDVDVDIEAKTQNIEDQTDAINDSDDNETNPNIIDSDEDEDKDNEFDAAGENNADQSMVQHADQLIEGESEIDDSITAMGEKLDGAIKKDLGVDDDIGDFDDSINKNTTSEYTTAPEGSQFN